MVTRLSCRHVVVSLYLVLCIVTLGYDAFGDKTPSLETEPKRLHTGKRGPFVVEAQGRSHVLVGLNWAEGNLASISHRTGLVLPAENYQFRIQIYVSPTTRVVKASATNELRDRSFVQKLSLHVSTGTPPPEVNLLLARQILHGMAWRPEASLSSISTFNTATAVPDWLVVGIYRNLNMQHRAMDSSIMLRLWQEGRIPTLAHVISQNPDEPQVVPPETTGFFMNWILSQTNHSDIMNSAFHEIRAGRSIDMLWMAGLVQGCSNRVAMEETWDRWVQRQRMSVVRPGVTSQAAIDRVKSCLVIYAGMNGAPRLHENNSRISLVELAALYREPWVAPLCDEKCVSLRLIALGQGQPLVDVVEQYCSFFQAIKNGTGPRTLQTMLQTAHTGLMTLEASAASVGYRIQSEHTEPGFLPDGP